MLFRSVSAHRIERLAHQLADLRPAMAIVGGAALGHTNALFTALAVNALNALLGNIGEPGGIYFTPQMTTAGGAGKADAAAAGSLDKLAGAILSGSMLVLHEEVIDRLKLLGEANGRRHAPRKRSK